MATRRDPGPDAVRPRWVFDALPPSLARRGGEPASHAFRQDIATFVREVLQNANDQAIEFPEVHFRFVELAGGDLADFRDAVRWPELERHLRAAARTRGGRAIAAALDDIRRRGRLRLLCVEDRNTVGLTGDELHGDSHFRALCKDTLYSHKRSDGAGGSYGLGKSVLWAFSGLSTVLFNSNLSEHAPGQRSPRLIGRAELPSHEVQEGTRRWYSGPGWFGRPVAAAEGMRAESVWGQPAGRLAERLHLARGDHTGTSLLILGFRDPTSDDEPDIETLAARIRDATVREFWPALTMPGRPLVVWVVTPAGGRLISARDLAPVEPFVDCYRGRHSDRDAVDEPGDVAVRDIPIDVPARRDGARAVRGHVRLCVRLAREDREGRADPLLGHVAWFRGPGMVVRYWDRRSLALGARPYHAVLACGEAREPEEPTDADRAVERFLRAAEPPGHDDWTTTAALKAEYKRGYAKALAAMKAQVSAALRELVVPRPRQGTTGPDRLRRRFPIGRAGGAGGGASAFRFSGLSARFEGGRWRFAGAVAPAQPMQRWECSIRLFERGEDGSAAMDVPIERIDDCAGATSVDIHAGVARVVAADGAREVAFSGRSATLSDNAVGRGELTLEVAGRGS
ncbi:MAG: hypothetical protein D6689_12355 [Deltaproteobacteria bacterium]|nr:MAG: hypothetical protein D6689_12355 [Deltaproteobacteria bacterium]